MFIRKTQTNNSVTGERYFTYRLVRGERIGGRVRQITLLNLGRHFAIAQSDWPSLCSRLEQLLAPQKSLLEITCSAAVERMAQHCYQQLMRRAEASAASPVSDAPVESSSVLSPSPSPSPSSSVPDFQEVDLSTLDFSHPRRVGVESVALSAIARLGLQEILQACGVNGVQRSAIIGNLVGRLAAPGSELSTWRWLQQESALSELIDINVSRLSLKTLYRASDVLMRHREVIEAHCFERLQSLFGLEETITLYDLTNTYFEGDALENPKARHGRSKEKRSDCPILTLGLVLDGSGFVRRSQTFAGNVSEGKTLETMLKELSALPGALVLLDAGIATEENLQWLSEQGYRYLVVRRGGVREFDVKDAITIDTAGGESLRLQRTESGDGKEVLLFCHSEGREAKERAMNERFGQAFEAGLQLIAEGLQKPRGEKRPDKIQERIGRLKARSHGVSRHYTISLTLDETGKAPRCTGLVWEKNPIDGTKMTHPGVYCLRTNELSWDEETLWRTYSRLTDIESVFRSLKGELGMRPVFHHKEDRSDGHLFITVLAYQCVQLLRKTLKENGITGSWASLRKTLSTQTRITARFRRKDGRTVHVRKASTPEPEQKAIYQALGLSLLPGGTKKQIV